LGKKLRSAILMTLAVIALFALFVSLDDERFILGIRGKLTAILLFTSYSIFMSLWLIENE